MSTGALDPLIHDPERLRVVAILVLRQLPRVARQDHHQGTCTRRARWRC
jgi:hypothetical protein